LPNVPMQGTQAMHLNFSHMAILVSYQPTWQPLVTPFVLSEIDFFLQLHTQCGIMLYTLT
jgi:hypothetical protein